ncbi:MAG: hypothetical protein BWY02_01962 [bacterium ADurb.Bin157]|nr:MAG: hypothetical protein BWY02_01962 [bacterium ADurb.Bin157]
MCGNSGNSGNSEKYEIDCYIESIMSEGARIKIIVKGDNGYSLERNSEKSVRYNCFWPKEKSESGEGAKSSKQEKSESGEGAKSFKQEKPECDDGVKLFRQDKLIEINEINYKIVELSYIHRKKIKLIVTVANNEIKIMSVKTV